MQGKLRDLTGQVFGRLTVVQQLPTDYRPTKHARWLCQCVCGRQKEVFGFSLERGQIKSCGCYRREVQRMRKRGTHGQHNTPLYHAWESLKQRCLNPKNPVYHRYGGRGITIDPLFIRSFEAFAKEIGFPPSPRHTIDRRDNNKGYEPGNLRWATRAEQSENREATNLLTYNGVTLSVTAWAKRLGLPYSTFYYRLHHWPLEKAMTTLY